MEPTLIWIVASISVALFMTTMTFLSVALIRKYAYRQFKVGDILKSKSAEFFHIVVITRKKDGNFEYKLSNEKGKVINYQVNKATPDHILYYYEKYAKKELHLRVVK